MSTHPLQDKPALDREGADSSELTNLQSSLESRERFRLALQACEMIPYEWDPVTDIVVIPDESALALGIGQTSQITGQHFLSMIHPEDQERVTAAIAGLVPDAPTIHANFRFVHSDRRVIQVETCSRALYDPAGRMVRISGIVADITARKLAELELVMSHDRLQLAMDAGKSVGWDWDVRSGADSWFGDLQTVFGIPSNIHHGHVEEFRRRVHSDDRALVWPAVKHAMQSQAPYVAEFRIIRDDGEVRWVAAQGKFYYLPDGEPERMLGIAVDITDRKITEEALRRKDIELANAQRLAQVGSWQWSPDTDTVVWSDELYRISGRDPRTPAVSYNEHSQLYTFESWQRLRLAVEEALRTGAQYELVMEMIRPDGTTRWVIGRGEVQRDSAGQILNLHGTVQDITERRHAQEALRESEERLRLAAQAGRMYAFEWLKATDVIVRSAEFTHILGLASEPKETTCRQMLTTVHPDDREKVIAATNACSPENPTFRIRYRVIRPDGSMVWLEKNALAFFDGQGAIVRMIGMIADITERKLAEETLSGMSRRLIEAQEAERSRIARDLHDDIGQRLAMLSVTLEQVKRAVPASENGLRGRMDELRNQVLDISTGIHALSHELHSSKLRHMDLVNAMRGFCTELSEQKKVVIRFGHKNVPGSVPPEISICLFRVLQEALHNAVKHSKVRHFEVDIWGTSDTIHLTVRDSGLGFDPEAAMNGQGLGLTSMQERLKLVDGELSIESRLKRGTTIHARVPFGRPAVAARAAG